MSRRDADEVLARLAALWEQERRATHERFVAERRGTTLAERVERGVALRDLAVDEAEAASGGRTLLWLVGRRALELDNLRVGPGDPVRLWWDDPDEPDATRGVVARRQRDRLGVIIDGDPPERLDDEGFRLDVDEPMETFTRGARAIAAFRRAHRGDRLARLRGVLCGEREAEFSQLQPLQALDSALNGPQIEAVRLALAAQDVALIHGPPGTGKTRTLVEVIRQCVAEGRSVLATAASNAATDNLAERLAAAGVEVVRVGHPARVAAAVEDRSLDALLEASPAWRLARQWNDEANRLRKKTERQWQRRAISREERRDARREVGRLLRDAREHLASTQEAILARAQVICATATGADSRVLGERSFDVVVLDEATQAVDPVALVALARGHRVVLAGDPCQLPPTVISDDAARQGLGVTFFERLREASAERLLRMLIVQHRMHAALMAFPSAAMYEGRLEAAAEVAQHVLDDLPGVVDDPLRPGPLVFLDTAGKGWEEELRGDDPSTANPAQAMRTAAEVRRLLSRGVAAADVALITPYNAQVRILRELLAVEREAGLEIGSIDSFQGREKEAVVVDLVRSNDDGAVGFLADVRRMNVAITRARRFLLVLGDSATVGAHPFYAAFLEHAAAQDAIVSAWGDEGEPL